jgi:hypothetical protein
MSVWLLIFLAAWAMQSVLPRIATGRTRQPTYRCSECRRLTHGPEGKHGSRCPSCDRGQLQNVARITTEMLAAHERAGQPFGPFEVHRKV